jgi:hypothetical protein
MKMNENKIELSGIFAEGYGIVPKKLMKANIDKNIKLIFAYMLSYTGAGNTCFPSIRTISKDLQMSSATITKYIKQACEMGYIEKSKLYPKNPLNHANKYKLLFLDVLPAKTTCINEQNTDVLTSNTTMYQPVIQNNNNINNNNNNKKNDGKPSPLLTIETFYLTEIKKVIPDYDIKTDYDYGKNRAVIKRLVNKHGFEKIFKLVKRYFENGTGEKCSYSLTTIQADWVWNKLLQGDGTDKLKKELDDIKRRAEEKYPMEGE